MIALAFAMVAVLASGGLSFFLLLTGRPNTRRSNAGIAILLLGPVASWDLYALLSGDRSATVEVGFVLIGVMLVAEVVFTYFWYKRKGYTSTKTSKDERPTRGPL